MSDDKLTISFDKRVYCSLLRLRKPKNFSTCKLIKFEDIASTLVHL